MFWFTSGEWRRAAAECEKKGINNCKGHQIKVFNLAWLWSASLIWRWPLLVGLHWPDSAKLARVLLDSPGRCLFGANKPAISRHQAFGRSWYFGSGKFCTCFRPKVWSLEFTHRSSNTEVRPLRFDHRSCWNSVKSFEWKRLFSFKYSKHCLLMATAFA